jgi:hypothetical protein
MAYVYEISFDIQEDQMGDLKIGGSLERFLGFLRTTLPGEPGYITSRALYKLDGDKQKHVVFMSEWQRWEDLEQHQQSSLMENKILEEFKPNIRLENLHSQILVEID